MHRSASDGPDETILEPALPIIDAHHHLMDRPTVRYMLDDYLADVESGHNVVASVYVGTLQNAHTKGPKLLRPLGEVEFANDVGEACANAPADRCRVAAAIVGHADLSKGDRVAKLLDLALEIAPERLQGVRQVTLEHPSPAPFRYIMSKHRPVPGALTRPKFRDGVRHAASRGLTLDVAVFHNQLPDLAALADLVPETTFILDCLGLAMGLEMTPIERAELFVEWRASLRDLSRRPNVVCKVGGLGMPFWGFGFEERPDPLGYRELASVWRPYVEVAVEAFGPDRCMMGSNFPPDGRSAGYVPVWNALKYIVQDGSAAEKALLFHDTAARVYRITAPPAPNPVHS